MSSATADAAAAAATSSTSNGILDARLELATTWYFAIGEYARGRVGRAISAFGSIVRSLKHARDGNDDPLDEAHEHQPANIATTTGSTPCLTNALLAHAYCNIGLLHAHRGEWYQAFQAFKCAARAQPSLALALYGLGVASYHVCNHRRAQAALARALAVFDRFAATAVQIDVALLASHRVVQPELGLAGYLLTAPFRLQRAHVEWNRRKAVLAGHADAAFPKLGGGLNGWPANFVLPPPGQLLGGLLEPERLVMEMPSGEF